MYNISIEISSTEKPTSTVASTTKAPTTATHVYKFPSTFKRYFFN